MQKDKPASEGKFGLRKNILKNKGTILILVVCIACTILVFINYFTLRVTTAVRAYVGGESLYSKGQKDASRNLILYILKEDERYFTYFEEDLSIPQGDGIARRGLLNKVEKSIIREGFLQGRNHKDDIDDMIWLFNRFKNIPFMGEAIRLWGEGDELIEELHNLGLEIQKEIQSNALNDDSKALIIDRINIINNELTIKERAFSDHLGISARKIKSILFIVNLIMILIIISSSIVIAGLMIREVELGKEKLRIKNDELKATNTELDNFIYMISHDLKSPLNNLEGLLNLLIMESENQPNSILSLYDKMRLSTQTIKTNINDIETLIRIEKGVNVDLQKVEFQELIQRIIEENEVTFGDYEIQLNLKEPAIIFSRVALKSILYNLISNAIKYRSPERTPKVEISTYASRGEVILEVKDNGLGMDLEKNKDDLFTMFKRFHNHVAGTGIGLYAIRQIIEKNGGQILVESFLDKGTTFKVVFPSKSSPDIPSSPIA